MGPYRYPDGERTVHHGQNQPSTASKIFRFACMVLLFSVCLAMTGGIVAGIIALSSSVSTNAPYDEGAQVHHLLPRSYYGNITASGNAGTTGTGPVPMNISASGNVGSTGTVPVSMNISTPGNVGPTDTVPASLSNITVVMSTTTSAIFSDTSSSVTLTANGVDTADASSEVGAAAVNATVTITSTSTTVTNTRTITETAAFHADAMTSSSEESGTGVVVSEPAEDCVPATVTVTVTRIIGGGASAQTASTSKAVTPFTTLIIPDLYSKEVKVGQLPSSSPLLNATTETAVIQEASETPATGNNLTTTITVFERPTVILTSTKILDEEMSSDSALPTGPVNKDGSPCMSENVTAGAPSMATVTLSKVITQTYTTTLGGSATLTTEVHTVFETEVVGVEKTVFVSGTVGALNNTSTALKTITVQPANPPAPEATETAASNGTLPVIVSEGTTSKLGNRGGGSIGGCVVMVVAIVLCML